MKYLNKKTALIAGATVLAIGAFCAPFLAGIAAVTMGNALVAAGYVAASGAAVGATYAVAKAIRKHGVRNGFKAIGKDIKKTAKNLKNRAVKMFTRKNEKNVFRRAYDAGCFRLFGKNGKPAKAEKAAKAKKAKAAPAKRKGKKAPKAKVLLFSKMNRTLRNLGVTTEQANELVKEGRKLRNRA